VVPVINLEWIQKIHRDRAARGYSTEAVMDVILRRMPDYVRYIVPQFALTNINFQRVPIPIEKVFAKLKHLLRKRARRTKPDVLQAIGEILDTYSPEECSNYLVSSGYASV